MEAMSNVLKTEMILDRLTLLTANRDTDMLEQSLLKTLADILHLREALLFKLSRSSEPYHIKRMLAGQEGGIANGLSPEDIPKNIVKAACQTNLANTPYIGRQGDEYAVMYAITGQEEVIGYVVLFMKDEFTQSQMQIVQGLLAIVNNFYSLLIDSQQDKLTGLLNRKTFDESISRICSAIMLETKPSVEQERRKSVENEERSNWLAILDIDFFKQVNDKFGHIYGDEVLLLMSQIMRRCFREEDLLFRFGGEEFLVVASFDDQDIARAVFERFRKEVQAFNFPQVGTVTVSIGAVQIDSQLTTTEIVGQADQALYYAKEHGRNCLYFYDDLVREGQLKGNVEAGSIDFF